MLEDELLAQLYKMAEMGVGGAFIHARFGLETEYLGSEWLRLIRVCCEKAKALDLKLWLYDENPFPSGIGGLKVTRVPDYRAKYLEMVRIPLGREVPEPEKALAIASDGKGKLVVYRRVLDDPKGKVFGPDYLNSEAMRYFLETTHEVYAAHLGEYFGNVIPGIFTDEPTLLPWHHDLCWYGNLANKRVVPWGDAMPSILQENGVSDDDWAPFLISLFDDGLEAERSSEYRRLYWRLISKLYKESFAEPYQKWCRSHGLQLTGHLLLEEGLYTNTLFEGNPVSILECFDIPGMDHLGADREYEYGGFAGLPRMLTNIQGEKLVSSIAHTRGRSRVLSETFGCAGWGLDLAAAKRTVDWQFIMGVNMLCLHAFFQSIEGYRKTDAPPSFMHNVSSKDFRLFADYTARVSYLLSQGVHRSAAAVLYPLEGFQSLYKSGSINGPEQPISKTFDLVCSALLKVQMDYDILDSEAIEAAGIDNGRLMLQGEEYSVLFMPGAPWLSKAVSEKLDDFRSAGGTIVEVYADEGEDGTSNSINLEALRGVLSDIPRDVAIDPPSPDVLYTERYIADSGEYVFFLVNTSSSPYQGVMKLNAAGRLREWNPETGAISVKSSRTEGCYVSSELFLPGNGSAVYSVSPSYPEADGTTMPGKLGLSAIIGSPWTFETLSPNVMPLDTMTAVFTSYNGGEDYRYMADFTAEFIPDDLQLLLDDIEYRDSYMGGMDLKLKVNERIVEEALKPYSLDHRLKLIDISDYLAKGRNEIEIVIRHSCWSGQPRTLTCAPKLLGSFGLSEDKHLKAPIGVIHAPKLISWTQTGYPYYSGTGRYTAEFTLDHTCNGFGEYASIMVTGHVAGSIKVWINGTAAGVRAWEPWTVEFNSSLLHRGGNTVVLEVTNTSQNFFESVPRESGIIGSVILNIWERKS